MIDKLPIHSPVWSTLESFGPDPNQLPQLIRKLQESSDPTNCSAFSDLEDQIYQQYSCCEATYAVVPHLVEIGAGLAPKEGHKLWILVGHIAGTCDFALEPPPPNLVPSFNASLVEAEPHCLSAFVAEPWDILTSYYLAVSALALAGHPLGKLVMDNLFPNKSANSTAFCPVCNTKVDVAFFDGGLVVRTEPLSRPTPPDPGRPPERPTELEFQRRAVNPWIRIGREIRRLVAEKDAQPGAAPHLELACTAAECGPNNTLQAGAAFSLLGAMITLKGFPKPAMRYFHAWDVVECPRTRTQFTFADNWWGVKQS